MLSAENLQARGLIYTNQPYRWAMMKFCEHTQCFLLVVLVFDKQAFCNFYSTGACCLFWPFFSLLIETTRLIALCTKVKYWETQSFGTLLKLLKIFFSDA